MRVKNRDDFERELNGLRCSKRQKNKKIKSSTNA